MREDLSLKIKRNGKIDKICPGLKIDVIYLKTHFSNFICVWVYTGSGH
jgi:hypothetical protein